MIKNVTKRIGRRGAAAAAVLAMAAGAVGVSAGSASANGWYVLGIRPTGHGVGVYSSPDPGSAKVANDVYSTSGSQNTIYLECWVRGVNIGGQGNVWYRIGGTNYNYFGSYKAYTYGAYVDHNWYFHNGVVEC
ncbi:hypothetical protein AB0O91_12010 [Kitasatospora sp. NPDC089797]|uniref:hypothetical protein n=1 Tax=Kitasatospora sp. NPDC089797 TaxID=3155298 RepID=UPI003445A669